MKIKILFYIIITIALLLSYIYPFASVAKLYMLKEELGIINTVNKLYASDPLLAWLIVLFSIFLPFLKLLGTGYLLFTDRSSKKIKKIIGLISKWSMADVFIVSILIAFAKSTSLAGTKLLPGVYFFTFAVLSMAIIDTYFYLKDT